MGNVEELLEQAEALFQSKQYAPAATAFENITKSFPNDPNAWLGWGRSLLFLGDRFGALEKTLKAIDISPSLVEALVRAGEIFAEFAQWDEAIERLRHATEIAPDRLEVRLSLGQVLAGAGRPEQARWEYEKALQLDPNSVTAMIGIGESLLAGGRPKEAAERFKEATETEQTHVGAWIGWGRALGALDEYEQALTKFETALSIDGNVPAAHLHAGNTLLELRAHERARSHFLTAVRLASEEDAQLSMLVEARFALARTLLILRTFDEALDQLDRLRSLFQHITSRARSKEEVDSIRQLDASVHLLSAVAFEGKKRYEDAIKNLRHAREMSPLLTVFATRALAFIQARRGLYQEAWQELRDIRDLHDSLDLAEVDLDSDYYLSLGDCYFAVDQYDDALKMYKQAVALDNNHAGAWRNLMVFYLSRREDDLERSTFWFWRAREASEKAEELLSTELGRQRDGETLLGLGAINLAMEQYDRADSYLKEAEAAGADARLVAMNVGLLHARRSTFDQAADFLKQASSLDPDNISIRAALAEAYYRMEAYEMAEAEYRSILRLAPTNTEAHSGLGETLTALGEKGDADLFDTAIEHFETAISLSKNMELPDPSARRASTRLSRLSLAHVYYSCGYARVKAAEAQKSNSIIRILPSGHLSRAAEDFKKAKEVDPEHFRAKRAQEKIERVIKPLNPQAIGNVWGPLLVVLLSVTLLLITQGVFFMGWGTTALGGGEWSLTTLGLLGLVIAGLYLPQILKLRVGGLELEKATMDSGAPAAIPISRSYSRALFGPSLGTIPDLGRIRPRNPGDEPPGGIGGAESGAKTSQPGDKK